MKNTFYIVAGIVLGLTTAHTSAYEWWTPSELTNTAAWCVWFDAAEAVTLRADYDGTTLATTIVGRWNDKSGKGNHARVWYDVNKPRTGVATIGGLNALSFVPTGSGDDNDDFLHVDNSASLNVDGSGGLSIFAVMNYDPFFDQGRAFNVMMCKKSYNSDSGYAIGMNANNNLGCKIATNRYIYAGVLTNQDSIVSYTRDDATTLAEAYSNGTLNATSTGAIVSDNTGRLTIGGEDEFNGGSDKNYASVDFGEIIILRGAPSAETRQKVEGYLAHKWNLVSNLPAGHPYKRLAPGQPPAGTVFIIR